MLTDPSMVYGGASPCFIAVHVGAGYHAGDKTPLYKAAMRRALQCALDSIRQGGDACAAATAAVACLEVRYPQTPDCECALSVRCLVAQEATLHLKAQNTST